MQSPTYHEWNKFTIQLQLAVLVAMEELRRKGITVRRRGLDVQYRIGRQWKPLNFDASTIDSII